MNRLTMLAVAAMTMILLSTARDNPRAAQAAQRPSQTIKRAVCVVQPTEGNKCRGIVHFEVARGKKIKVTATISGLTPNQKHAIHIHQYGDTTDLTGKSAGGHYNPENYPHGLPPAKERHAGDLGNLQADATGTAKFSLTVDNISLTRRNAILGRAIVVHAQPDDGGQPTGNAGARIGFGVIGVASPAQ